jgi:RNA polymerase sigma-70 factor (ECF subfamily)
VGPGAEIGRNLIAMTRVTKMEEEQAAGRAAPVQALSAAAIDERQIVRRAQKGDKAAFELLVERHQHRVFAVARGIVKRQEDAEDVAQQVFVKAYFSLKRFDQRAAFSTWLYKITVNECWDLLRKRKARPLVYESDFNDEQSSQFSAIARESAGGPDASERLAMRQRLDNMLDQLEPRDRSMLELKEVEGFSVEEIAELLGLNANTVKVRLFRARRRIVEYVRREQRES